MLFTPGQAQEVTIFRGLPRNPSKPGELHKYQIPAKKKISEYEIAKIEVTELREGTKVTQKRDTYTEPEEIKQIAEKLVYQGYAIQPVLNPVDTETKVEVKFQNNSRETVYTVDYYIK